MNRVRFSPSSSVISSPDIQVDGPNVTSASQGRFPSVGSKRKAPKKRGRLRSAQLKKCGRPRSVQLNVDGALLHSRCLGNPLWGNRRPQTVTCVRVGLFHGLCTCGPCRSGKFVFTCMATGTQICNIPSLLCSQAHMCTEGAKIRAMASTYPV